MTRSAALTVLLPGARIAPASSTCTWGHTRLENSGTKGLSRCSIVIGRVRIITSLWRTGDDRTLPLLPYRMDKVELVKLSEKGCGRRFEHEFGWYTEAKMGRKAPLRWPVRLSLQALPRLFRQFRETVRKGS